MTDLAIQMHTDDAMRHRYLVNQAASRQMHPAYAAELQANIDACVAQLDAAFDPLVATEVANQLIGGLQLGRDQYQAWIDTGIPADPEHGDAHTPTVADLTAWVASLDAIMAVLTSIAADPSAFIPVAT